MGPVESKVNETSNSKILALVESDKGAEQRQIAEGMPTDKLRAIYAKYADSREINPLAMAVIAERILIERGEEI